MPVLSKTLLERQALGRTEALLGNIRDNVDKILSEVTTFSAKSKAFRWGAIVVGATANFAYTGYYALATILETEGAWSIRLWMVTAEHWWFTLATLVLALSLGLDLASFFLGEDVDATILLLALELGIAINNVLIHAYRTSGFRKLLYECWAGQSRTARPIEQRWMRDAPTEEWQQAIRESRKLVTMPTESIWNPHNWGFRKKVRYDVTEAMEALAAKFPTRESSVAWSTPVNVGRPGFLQIYPYCTETSISVAWGGNSSTMFQKRVSRGILALKPSDIKDAYSLRLSDADRWFTAASGVLARNKGLEPWKLIFKRTKEPSNQAEILSPLFPRPAKTLYTRTRQKMKEQYGGLGADYVEAATELALLLRDNPIKQSYAWLRQEAEHQDLVFAWQVVSELGMNGPPKANYFLQYVGMCASLNLATALEGGKVRIDAFVFVIANLMTKAGIVDVSPDSQAAIDGMGQTQSQVVQEAQMQARRLPNAAAAIVASYLGHYISKDRSETVMNQLRQISQTWEAALGIAWEV